MRIEMNYGEVRTPLWILMSGLEVGCNDVLSHAHARPT